MQQLGRSCPLVPGLTSKKVYDVRAWWKIKSGQGVSLKAPLVEVGNRSLNVS